MHLHLRTFCFLLILCQCGSIQCAEEWINCASEGGTCYAEGAYVWARYGNGQSWNYRAVWNTSFPCNGNFFGSPVGTTTNVCYFLKSFKYVILVYAAEEGQNFVTYFNGTVPSDSIVTGELFYGHYSDAEYYLLDAMGFLYCGSSQFGAEPPATGQRSCYTTLLAQVHSAEECAFDDNTCVVPDGSAIYPLIYQGYGNEGYDTSLLRYASSSGAYSCSKSSLFLGSYPPQNAKNTCYFDPTEKIQFVAPIGEWKQVELCSGNITCSYSLCYGVTSTTSQATTTEWSASLSETIEESLYFEKDSLTTTVSTSVSNTISSAYSQTASKSCAAACTVNPDGQAYLWQWQVTTEEVNYSGVSVMEPFTTFACSFLCTNSTNAPKCPPGYCSNTESCQTCTQDIYNVAQMREQREKEKEEQREIVRQGEVIRSIVEKYEQGNRPVILVPEDIEPELRQELIEERGFIPIESLNLPPQILQNMVRSKRMP